MNPIIQQAINTARHNPLQGAWAVTVLGAIGTALWTVPIRLCRWAQSTFVVHVSILGSDPLYSWVVDWLADHQSCGNSRILTASGKYEADESLGLGTDNPSHVVVSPGPGSHFFFYKGRPVWLMRTRSEAQGGSLRAVWREELHFRAFGRKAGVMTALFEEARLAALEPRDDKVSIHLPDKWGQGWTRVARRKMRSLNSVILPEGVEDRIRSLMSVFLSGQDWYREAGIPHRLGLLLYGPPGAGKSSLISAIAGHFRMDLYILALSNKEMSDGDLLRLLSSLQGQKMILMLEDVDAVFVQRASETQSGVTFSGLLNALDGVAAQEGRVLVMTTNHIDRLDEALIRDGRVDHRIELTWPTRDQVTRLHGKFFRDVPVDARHFADLFESRECSMAAIQGVLLKNGTDPEAAYLAASDLAKTKALAQP